MQALVKTKAGPGNVEICDFPEPQIKDDEVKIKVKACGICGTDMHILHGSIDSSPPVIMGHELAGEIVEVGSGVKDIKVGDRVTSETHAHLCNNCLYCRIGYPRYCVERKMVGRHGNGGFAEFFVTRGSKITILNDKVDFESGAITEPLFTVTHALIERANIQAGSVIGIVGPGPMGLLALQVAKAAGATVVMVGLSKDKDRLELSRELGADKILMADKDDVEVEINKLTSDYGLDYAVECSGSPKVIPHTLSLLKKMGKLLVIGLNGYRKVEISTDHIVFNGIEVIGTVGTTATAKEKALELLRTDKVDLKPLISDVLPLSKWKEGFDKMDNKEGLKIILKP